MTDVSNVEPADATLRELRVCVERVVRPIAAEIKTKMRMRRELYAHACASYEQQRQRGRSVEESVRRAAESLGDAAGLTAELQATVPWSERGSYWIDDRMRRDPDTPRWRHAAWVSLVSLLFLSITMILVGLLSGTGILPGASKEPVVAARITALITLLFALSLFHGAYLGGLIYRDLGGDAQEHPRPFRAVLFALLGGVFLFLSGYALWPVVGWPDVVPSTKIACCWSALSAIYSASLLLTPWLDLLGRRVHTEWLQLELD